MPVPVVLERMTRCSWPGGWAGGTCARDSWASLHAPGYTALCPLSAGRSGPLPPGPLPSDPPAPSFCTPTPEAAQPPPHSSEAASHANVFRIHDISETSICIYLDSISKELFKTGAIWIDGCGTDCFLSAHVKNTMFSKWITNAVIIEMGTFCWGKITKS